jgi:hypothetical protein
MECDHMDVSSFVQAIVDNNISKVESLINKYKRLENTTAFPNKLNVVVTYTFRKHLICYDRPLHAAARFGHIRIIRLLINEGAPIDQHNEYGETPLIVALSNLAGLYGSIDITSIVKMLLDLGCSLQGDNSNSTPLHWARALAQLLPQRGWQLTTRLNQLSNYFSKKTRLQCTLWTTGGTHLFILLLYL